MTRPTIIFASDHAGYPLKELLKSHVQERGYTVEDLGTHSLQSTDYPVHAKELCARVLETGGPGILICGTGIGVSITANRIPGIRAALCGNEFMARMSRMHNNANVLCMGDRVVGPGLARSITDTFLDADFEGDRHLRRINMIDE
ncbi:MAG TPA: ribose 5-phosphate isomerase B [Desulfomicrobiaceae bacterium]|jgi:ribose 5-phosphate isomerase B|nr:ribose 5-phosphate isomerase B [Desulfomicrobiaceae bacterium]